MSTKLTLFGYSRDNGDGSQGAHFYGSLEELKQGEFTDSTGEFDEERFNLANGEGTFYDDGSIEEIDVDVEVSPDGQVRLAKDFYLELGDQ